MQVTTEERRRWRQEYVDCFLNRNSLHRDAIARSTLKCLDEWARQVQLVENQPSASWGNVVLQLCKAVESELAAGIGTMSSLEFLSKGTLGEKAKALQQCTKLKDSVKQQLSAKGIKPGFVAQNLASLLGGLAKLRRDTGAAHGNADILPASAEEAVKARNLAGSILKGIVSDSGKKSQ